MNIVICGAGEVGQHAAEVFSSRDNNITIIDLDEHKLQQLNDRLDVRSMEGNGAQADVLLEAGCANADLFIAATQKDEINLLSAAVAKAVGAERTVARVHHSAYFDRRGLDYGKLLGIDHLVCPELTTARAIAAALRSPAALAIEQFAMGNIEMQRIRVSNDAKAAGKTLMDIRMPGSARVAAVHHAGTTTLPTAQTEIDAGDVVTLIGDADGFEKVCKVFDTSTDRRRRVMVMGGSTQGVWVCRALKHRLFSVRMFEPRRERAVELSEKLDWVTVLQADVINSDVLQDERVDLADAFVAVTDDDEENILAAARAKSMGCDLAIAVLQRSTYVHLLSHVGIDKAFSPRTTAVHEIQRLLDEGPVRILAPVADGVIEAYEVSVPRRAGEAATKSLRDWHLPAQMLVAAIQRGTKVFVPNADDHIEPGDNLIIIAPTQKRKELSKLFLGK